MLRNRRTAAVLLATSALGGGAVTAAVVAGPALAASTEVVHLSASSSGMLMFNTTHLTVAKPGKVELVMSDPSSSGVPHGIAITGNGVNVKSKIVSPGQTATVTATLKKGTYTYYCPVPGHEAAGMKGTLTVK